METSNEYCEFGSKLVTQGRFDGWCYPASVVSIYYFFLSTLHFDNRRAIAPAHSRN